MAVFKRFMIWRKQRLMTSQKLKEQLLRFQTMYEFDQISEGEYQARG